MEHDLNMIAGGKPFAPPVHINCRCKPEYHEKDIEGYNGKWKIEILFKNNILRAISADTYNSEEDAEKVINQCWLLGVINQHEVYYLPNEIAMILPMPTT